MIATNPTTTATFYAVSRLLERAAYYGLRSVLIFYMISEAIQMEEKQALRLYGFLGIVLIASRLMGGLLGDLWLGSKKAMILGGVLQAMGAFVLCISSETALYVGGSMVLLGTGLYTPNVMAGFGKSLLSHPKRLDIGFILLYLIVNLGSFVGVLLIDKLSLEGDMLFKTAFVVSGLLFLVAQIPVVLAKPVALESVPKTTASIGFRVLMTIAIVLVGSVFWLCYELGGSKVLKIELQFGQEEVYAISKSIWTGMGSFISFGVLPIVLLVSSIWRSGSWYKVGIGFMSLCVAYGLLLTLPETVAATDAPGFLISLLALGIAEALIAPMVYALITQYVSAKYLAIAMACSFVTYGITNLFYTQLFDVQAPMSGTSAVTIALPIALFFLLVVVVLAFLQRHQERKVS